MSKNSSGQLLLYARDSLLRFKHPEERKAQRDAVTEFQVYSYFFSIVLNIFLRFLNLNYTFFLPVDDPFCGDRITYWFQYKGLDLTEREFFLVGAGGPITRQFLFENRPFMETRNTL